MRNIMKRMLVAGLCSLLFTVEASADGREAKVTSLLNRYNELNCQGNAAQATEAFCSAASGDERAAPDTAMPMTAGYAYQAAELDADAGPDGRRVSSTRLQLIIKFDF